VPKYAKPGNTPGNQSPGVQNQPPVQHPTTPSSQPPSIKAIPSKPSQDKRPK
jgi:hypothetical protein